jgi:hypothetical protein
MKPLPLAHLEQVAWDKYIAGDPTNLVNNECRLFRRWVRYNRLVQTHVKLTGSLPCKHG